MSLRILFADDSVTAQNMGKKILTEAGYEVVAVSNGAAAVKKIAEQKPDIIILDVYMPGYSGLEVCEKVRGSMETMKTPVLLTVGKLEPYKPEDANRVRADGVIVKPFEASDLLAIVKKFEERINQALAMPQPPAQAERVEEEPIAETAVEPPPVEHAVSSPPAFQSLVEVPDHMATTAAFSDLLGGEPAVPVNHFDPAPPPVAVAPMPPPPMPPPPVGLETTPPVTLETIPVVLDTPPLVIEMPVPARLETAAFNATEQGTVPDYEVPISWREPRRVEAELSAVTAPPAPPPPPMLEPEPEPLPHPTASRPLQIPIYRERETADAAYELMPTSAPPLGQIDLPREPHLQETAAEATRQTVADTREPGLLSTGQQFEGLRASADAIAAAEMAPLEEEFPAAGFQDIPTEITSHLPLPAAEPPAAAPAETAGAEPASDADFEARVAAALSAYGHQPAPTIVAQPPARDFAESLEITATPAGVDSLVQAAAAQEAVEPVGTDFPATLETAAAVDDTAFSSILIPHVSEPAARLGDAPPALTTGEMAPVAEAAPVFEYHPASAAPPDRIEENVSTAYEPVEDTGAPPEIVAPVEAVPETELHSFESPSHRFAAVNNNTPATVAAGIESALPAVAVQAAAVAAEDDPAADHQAIAQAVHTAMERLKPALVEEILRELRSKKA